MADPAVFTVTVPRIDYAAAPAFQEALLGAVGEGTGALIVDFAQVETISSVGLRALVMAAKKTRAGGGRIAVATLQPIVKEVFTISRFDAILPMFETVDAARGALAS